MELDNELKSHFLNLYSMALTDTQVDSSELQFLFHMGTERGIPKEEIENIILFPNKVSFTVPSDVLKKIEYLYDFARMAWANEIIDEYEIVALKKFCAKFGFDPENVDSIVNFLIEEAKKGTEKNTVIEIVKQNL
jgi:hypothetical protein